jgi:hypothetical protein
LSDTEKKSKKNLGAERRKEGEAPHGLPERDSFQKHVVLKGLGEL